MLVKPFSFTFHIPISNYKILIPAQLNVYLPWETGVEIAVHPSLLSKQGAVADLSWKSLPFIGPHFCGTVTVIQSKKRALPTLFGPPLTLL